MIAGRSSSGVPSGHATRRNWCPSHGHVRVAPAQEDPIRVVPEHELADRGPAPCSFVRVLRLSFVRNVTRDAQTCYVFVPFAPGFSTGASNAGVLCRRSWIDRAASRMTSSECAGWIWIGAPLRPMCSITSRRP